MDKLVMSKDRVVARFDAMNHLVWKDEDLCPLHIKRTENLDGWLASRAIDSHRPNSRLLKKALRLAERDDVNTVLSVHAVTVTDTYWVKNADSDLTWDDVRFQKDYFSILALKGDYNSFTSANKSEKTHTQELTNIGSFEKCWRLKDGVWWLYKQADAQELFSEYFICLLGKRLGFNIVPFLVSWTVKMKKKQKETQDILSYHTQAAGCSDKARAKASGGRQPIEECGRTGL